MSDQPSPTPTVPPDPTPPPTQPPPTQEADDTRVREMAKHKRSAEQKAAALERQLAEIQAQLEEREHANLPELERERKQRESIEKRLQEAERRAQEAEEAAQTVQKERLVSSAAAAHDFRDPEDASLFVSLADIETRQDAEREIKRLKKDKPYLFKADDKLPGQVVQNGQPVTPGLQPETQPLTTEDQELLQQIQGKLNSGWSSTTFG